MYVLRTPYIRSIKKFWLVDVGQNLAKQCERASIQAGDPSVAYIHNGPGEVATIKKGNVNEPSW